jgi:Tfp pilus assembly PilM family ATPase
MKDYTIHDIIKLVPMKEETRQKLLSEFDTYDKGTQLELKNTIWSAFHKMTDVLAQQKYEEFLQESEKGERKLTPTLMQEARMAVHQDYEDKLAGKKPEKEQMEEVRESLQTITQPTPLPGFDQRNE